MRISDGSSDVCSSDLPVIGRAKKIERVMQVLSRRQKNNPVLVGEPGVGNTAVVEGLAQKIVATDVPETSKDKQLYTLEDRKSVVSGKRGSARCKTGGTRLITQTYNINKNHKPH